jgi:hypothetical protein
MLSGFETRYERVEYENVKKEIESLDALVMEHNNTIGSILAKKNDRLTMLLGLERKIAESDGDSEIMEYFLCNNRLYLDGVTDTDMYFTVSDYLEYFDKDMAEGAINNRRSYVYKDGAQTYTGVSADKMKMLMTELFVAEEPRLRIKMCAAYRFNLNGSVSAMGHHCYGYEFGDCMPNPHIDRYSCMGNYVRTINQLLSNRNYIGALEQCVASCKSLNFGDSPVMEWFMQTMWGNGDNNRCIELPDGRVVKPNEAINWLEEQNVSESQPETEETQDE